MTVLSRSFHAVLMAAAMPVLLACTAAPATPDAAPVVAMVIAKPRSPASGEAVLRIAQTALGRDAGVRYARPLAGDAHLLYLTAPASKEQVPALVERLRASGEFQYVELDSAMKIQ